MGCGTSNLKEHSLVETDEKVVFPQNLRMTLPRKLEPNREMLTQYSSKSYTYETMQSTIIKYRDNSEFMALDLMVVENIFPEILNNCRERTEKDTCTLPANTLTLKLTRPYLRALKKVYAYLDFTWDVNNSLSLGEVSYKKYDEGNETHYFLQVDLLPMYNDLMGKAYESFFDGDSLLKHFQSLHWSENNETVELTAITESNSSRSKLTLEYLHDNKQEMVQAYQESLYGESNSHEMFTFMKLNDANNSYVFRYNDAYSSEFYNSVHYAYAILSDSTGFHVTNSASDNSQMITFFDKNGNELGQYGCEVYDECSLSDTSSWGYGGESEENASRLDKEFNVKFYNLRADSTTLKDGYYLLLPKEFNTKASSLKNSVGFIWVFKEKLYGALYDETYRKQLDKLKIIQVIENGATQTIYDKILQKNYPKLYLETEILR